MDKDIIQQVIKESQDVINKSTLIRRGLWIEPNFNYVFTGMRRVGKSYYMLQIAQQLLAEGHSVEEFLFFNFEDDRLDDISVKDFDLIKRSYEEMF